MHKIKIIYLIIILSFYNYPVKCADGNKQIIENSTENDDFIEDSSESSNSESYDEYEDEIEPDFVELVIKEINKNNSDVLTPDQKFQDSYKKIRNIFNIIMKRMSPLMYDSIYELNIEPQCLNSLAIAGNAISTNQEWAFKMLDSIGHFPPGSLSGTITALGDYDQCLSVHSNEYDIYGKYCFLKARPALPKKNKDTFKYKLINLSGTELNNTWFDESLNKQLYGFYYYYIINGICVPSTCSENDIKILAEHFLNPFHVIVEIDNCVTINSKPFEIRSGQIYALIIVLLFIFISIFCTIFDILAGLINMNEKKLIIKIIQCFSAKKNTENLFDCDSKAERVNTKNFQFMNGMKVVSSIWILIGHTYIAGVTISHKDIPTANFFRYNIEGLLNLPKQFVTQVIINNILAVDTFFFISGLLIVYITITKINKGIYKLRFCSFLFLRWIRFTPALMGVICIQLLWPLLGSGPFFQESLIKHVFNPCYYGWWRNILFISNWYPFEDQCMIQTWYLSAEIQYYIISFFLISIISYDLRMGTFSAIGLTIIGIIVPTIFAYKYDFPPTIPYEANIENTAYITSLMHYYTYNHITTYFFGTFVGCLLLHKRDFRIKPILGSVIWIVTISGTISVPFMSYVWSGLEWKSSAITAALYYGFHRFIWISGIAWIAFNCCHNRAGIINSILSAKIFLVLSRLTFCIYLTHISVIMYNFFHTKHLFTANHYDLLFTSSGVFGFTLILSYFCHIIFEAPIDRLVKLITSLNMKRKQSNSEMNGKIVYKL